MDEPKRRPVMTMVRKGFSPGLKAPTLIVAIIQHVSAAAVLAGIRIDARRPLPGVADEP